MPLFPHLRGAGYNLGAQAAIAALFAPATGGASISLCLGLLAACLAGGTVMKTWMQRKSREETQAAIDQLRTWLAARLDEYEGDFERLLRAIAEKEVRHRLASISVAQQLLDTQGKLDQIEEVLQQSRHLLFYIGDWLAERHSEFHSVLEDLTQSSDIRNDRVGAIAKSFAAAHTYGLVRPQVVAEAFAAACADEYSVYGASTFGGLDAFVGRNGHLAQIAEFLANDNQRVLHYSAAPGTGVTRLMLETATRAERAGWLTLFIDQSARPDLLKALTVVFNDEARVLIIWDDCTVDDSAELSRFLDVQDSLSLRASRQIVKQIITTDEKHTDSVRSALPSLPLAKERRLDPVASDDADAVSFIVDLAMNRLDEAAVARMIRELVGNYRLILKAVSLVLEGGRDWKQELQPDIDAVRMARARLAPQSITSDAELNLDEKKLEFLRKRLGSALSMELKPEYVDRFHEYSLLYRQDLLDYTSGDFVSIRRIRGRNVTESPSLYVPYVESSEVKVRFSECELQAYSVRDRKPLVAVPFHPEEGLVFQVPFKIYFSQPIAPGEDFDIVYRIRLPNELIALQSKEEIMTISLVRLQRPPARLEFNVALNFEPRAVSVETMDLDRTHYVVPEPPPNIVEYTPHAWFEEELSLPWDGGLPYNVQWATDNVDMPLYIIRYWE